MSHELELLIQALQHYADPATWRKFPLEDGTDANGMPVVHDFFIGDGGIIAQKTLRAVLALAEAKHLTTTRDQGGPK